MTTITKYIACDGTEFDDEYDCSMYESKIKIRNLQILMWDSNFKFLNRDNIDYDIENMTYFCAESKEDLEAFIEILEDDYGYCMDEVKDFTEPWKGVWGFNSSNSVWENCNNLYDHYKYIVETLT